MAEIFDPLFRVPFLTGLLITVALCEVGVFLRLREEWMAALGIAHLAAAGALVAVGAGFVAMTGAAACAFAAVVLKQLSGRQGNTAYALMYLCGWGLLMLVAANTTLGHALGRALLDGQLYFAGPAQLAAAAFAAVALLGASRWFTRRLLRARLLPDYEHANALPAWRWHLGFDLAVAAVLALAIATVGVVAAFALAFVPAWMAFRLAGNWRACRWISISVGSAAYLITFALCLLLDQPFGPVLVVVLLAAGLASLACGAPWRIRPLQRDKMSGATSRTRG